MDRNKCRSKSVAVEEEYDPGRTAAGWSGGAATAEEVGVFARETIRHYPHY